MLAITVGALANGIIARFAGLRGRGVEARPK
jgi:hypothetical protein